MISKCYLHPRDDAMGKCSVCNKPVCSKCGKKYEGKIVCRNCVGKKTVSHVDTDELERQEKIEKAKEESRKGRTR
jgi:hypothetical protein